MVGKFPGNPPLSVGKEETQNNIWLTKKLEWCIRGLDIVRQKKGES